MKRFFAVLFACTIIVSGMATSLYAGICLYDISTVKTYYYDVGDFEMNDLQQVVWMDHDNNDWEAYLHDGTQVLQLTNNDLNERYVDISNDGHVVWANEQGLFLYDIATGGSTQISSDFIMEPRISNSGFVTWAGDRRDDGDPYAYEIYRYEIATGVTLQITNNGYYDAFPEINDSGAITWEGQKPRADGKGSSYEVFLYNGTDILQLSDDDMAQDVFPHINNNGRVVWTSVGNGARIFLYDGTSVSLISDTASGLPPMINDNNYVVWYASNSVNLYDGTVITQIGDHSVDPPRINDNNVVIWNPRSGSGQVIYRHDIADGTNTQITQNWDVVHQRYPKINNNDYVIANMLNFRRLDLVKPWPPAEIKHDGIDQDCNGYDLTIDIAKVKYSSNDDSLHVEATSSLGAGAGLELTGFGTMIWKSSQQKWVGSVEPAGGDPGSVTVCGIEGCESAQTITE